jgi:hypothetical protein
MRAILIASFLFSCIFPVSAQITLSNNGIRPGDMIVKQQVAYKEPGRSGVNVIWDFSKLESVDPEYKLNYSAPRMRRDSLYILGKDTFRLQDVAENELITGREHKTNYYYRVKDSALYCLGYQNPTVLMQYVAPIPVVVYPMNYEQEIDHDYRSECLYSQQVSMLTHGHVHVKADALGKMILPSKDTLGHVIRIHSIQTFLSDTIKAMDSIRINTTIETCKWYSRGYRYPVFETVRTVHRIDSLEDVFTTAFFYPPQEHYYLEDDEENMALLDSIASENAGEVGEISSKQWLDDNFMYNFYPNPIAADLYIEYHLAESAEVGISLYNSATGISRQIPVGMKQAGYYSETFDCSGFPPGTYVLSFHVRGEVVSSIIFKR